MTHPQTLAELLQFVYGDDTLDTLLEAVEERIERMRHHLDRHAQPWSNDDVVLITYGDSVTHDGEPPLQVLTKFIERYLDKAISAVHLLPFFPYSSDDGFSVIDYYQVNYRLGDWQDVRQLAKKKELMVDLVMNHTSRQSLLFIDFINGEGTGAEFFIEADPALDYSLVTRPRTSPLVVDVYTRQGVKHVWATFSADQIDVNFRHPKVFLAYLDILLFYIQNGARYIRLDAVAFIWKELGTKCIHLPQTHALVKVIRAVMERIDSNLILITETNVPHHENVSYFGQGNEAHMVYQFALPPLLLHALNRGNASYLNDWARHLEVLPSGCSYFNFVASHDGIGVRPVESLIPAHEMDDLLKSVRDFGGFVSMKTNPDGSKSPYELNISLYEAMQGTRSGPDLYQLSRYLCCQLVMLAMPGIPGIYMHSLTATPNDLQLVEQTGRTRSINRHSWDLDEFEAQLEIPSSGPAQVFHRLIELISLRRKQIAFHPQAAFKILSVQDEALFVLERTSMDGSQRILAMYNMTRHPQEVAENAYNYPAKRIWDLISEEWVDVSALTLAPYQVLWLLIKHPSSQSLPND
ncbi:alpha-amylase family glycosyl hydrolase [Celerinatantimonas yamalensis]|uniref:Alpha-amylase family glycosyl hydrolase n=1 Tax=Celerinatantimonas yamalensis TaxID=559956 RepID=A0ABW9G6I7_9GAMM